ncbi:hypothetical protein [Chryseobacterium sp.]|uniref:hypothetical protein n=1 Tax=Chryseobacterium sp. TaxID=1871047 RepID=UPI0028970EF9|nr:hypothetical protein [Chryseobacterium sp.]
MKNLIIGITVLLCPFFKSQYGSDKDWKIIELILSTRIEATSIDNKAFFSFGPKIPINENNYVSLRGHFNWWDLPDRKFIVIPELDYFRKIATFEDDKNMIKHLYAGAGITPNAISPKFGVNFYYFFTAELGYNFEYRTYKYFPTEGFRFSFGINLVF